MICKRYESVDEERESIDGCPRCGSTECRETGADYCGKEYSVSYECLECGQEFTEIYAYRSTEWMKEA